MAQPINTCNRCNKVYKGRPALSRTDNKTEICPLCGNLEALEVVKDFMSEAEYQEAIKEITQLNEEIFINED